MTDYSRSKYDSAVAEWADAIVGQGFADAEVGSVDTGGHYALVTLYYGATDAEIEAAATDGVPRLFDGARVILRTDSQGFVWADYGPTHPAADPVAYAALMAQWESIESEATE